MFDLEFILMQHADDIWRTVYRLLDNREDARECYQQTLLDAIQLDASTVRNWQAVLRRIATRRAIDRLRRRYRERHTLIGLEAEPAHETPPDRGLLHQELRASVREVLATLPPAQAEAFWLRHIEHMQPVEIAAQLGVEPNHVRVLVHRAVAQLRLRLGPTYGHLLGAGQKT